MNPPLRLELERVVGRESARRWHSRLAIFWGAGAVMAAVLVALGLARVPVLWPSLILAVGLITAYLTLRWRRRSIVPDRREVALLIEHRHPELQSALLTALDQKPEDGQFTFLQRRVMDAALDSAQFEKWDDVAPASQVLWRMLLQRTAAVATMVLLAWLVVGSVIDRVSASGIARTLEIRPGNAEVERGTPVTFTARFAKTVPPEAALRVVDEAGKSREVPLSRTLQDPIFTASLPAVNGNLKYRVAFAGHESEEFTLKVYDPPRVERVDADLNFPSYTGRAPAHLDDTHSIAAIEQTALKLQVRTNKPMQSVELKSKDGRVIPLHPSPKDPSLYEAAFPLDKSGDFQVALKDDAGRPNSHPDVLSIKVHPNLAPVVKATLPASGDRATPLQEVSFEASVEDDFGLHAAGLTVQLGNGKPIDVSLPSLAPGSRSTKLSKLVKLEELGAKPNDLVMWHAWGEDVGPDGKPRRTNGDIRIMQVRPFDISNHQREAAEGQAGEPRCKKIIRIETQILAGTWNVQRDSAPKALSPEEMKTLANSQSVAIELAQDLAADYASAELRQHANAAEAEMKTALGQLQKGGTENLPPAIASEQSALTHLYQLINNDMDYALAKNGETGPSSSPLDEIDLKNMTPRYEEPT
ncbi:MAG TPA: DUF4175 family protein, partial [Chthoniobacterales bacterium]|nr:DUF4175 family protein [Chthoniobacterales bacterium]